MTEKKNTVFAKLAALQASVRALAKDSQAYGYDYTSGSKILAHVRPKMDELGLLLMPSVENVTISPVTYSQYDRKAGQVVEKTENLTVLDMTMTWVDSETGDQLACSWKGVGQNGFDKGFGSALTYAERYYLLKTLHIATDEDDVDAIAAVRDRAVAEAAQAQAYEAQAPQPQGPVYPDVPAVAEAKDTALWAISEAIGNRLKSGATARQGWVAKFRPTPEQLAYFDDAVAGYRAQATQGQDLKTILAELKK